MLAQEKHSPKGHGPDAIDTPQFQRLLGQTRELSQAISLFDRAIAPSGPVGHQCNRTVLRHVAIALFGSASPQAQRISRMIRMGEWDIEQPLLLPSKRGSEAMLLIPVPVITSDPLVISINYGNGPLPERAEQSRLHGLALIYAHKALTLWEIDEDIETSTPLSLNERIVFAMLLCGHPHFDIAEAIGSSIPTVSAHIERARHKLKLSDTAAAVAMAARRGWLHLPGDFGKHQRGIDS